MKTEQNGTREGQTLLQKDQHSAPMPGGVLNSRILKFVWFLCFFLPAGTVSGFREDFIKSNPAMFLWNVRQKFIANNSQLLLMCVGTDTIPEGR